MTRRWNTTFGAVPPRLNVQVMEILDVCAGVGTKKKKGESTRGNPQICVTAIYIDLDSKI